MDDFATRFECVLRLGALIAAAACTDDDLEQREIAADHFRYILTGEVETPANEEAREKAGTYTRAAISRIKASKPKK